MDDLDAFDQLLPGWSEEVMRTLKNFELVATTGRGAVIAPRMPAGSSLRENLVASVVADRMRLTSVDYTRRQYVDELPPHDRQADLGIVEAYHAARKYMEERSASFDQGRSSDPSLGVFAASVALDRLPPSFVAAKFLYQIGLHHEGDAVARQILEQIAWAVTARGFDSHEQLQAIKPTNMQALKAVAKHAGPMYGLLSDSTHMRLAHHRELFTLNEDGRGTLSLTWKRERVSAQILLVLADLWVVAFEWTQFEYMKSVQTLQLDDQRRLRPDRPFLAKIDSLIADIPG